MNLLRLLQKAVWRLHISKVQFYHVAVIIRIVWMNFPASVKTPLTKSFPVANICFLLIILMVLSPILPLWTASFLNLFATHINNLAWSSWRYDETARVFLHSFSRLFYLVASREQAQIPATNFLFFSKISGWKPVIQWGGLMGSGWIAR